MKHSSNINIKFLILILSAIGYLPIANANTPKGTAPYDRYPGDRAPYSPTIKSPGTVTTAAYSPEKDTAGAASLASVYSKEDTFERMNGAFGGLFSNVLKATRFVKRIENEIANGSSPREAMTKAVGLYLTRATSRFEDRGIRIVIDPSIPPIESSLAFYKSTQGSDVPRLKKFMLNGRSRPEGNNDSGNIITEVYLYPDQVSRDIMIAQLGNDNFAKIYSSELINRTANPQRDVITIKSEADAIKYMTRFVELFGAPSVDTIYNVREGDSQVISIFDGNPSKRKLFPNPNWVVVEYPPQFSQAFNADQAQSFNWSYNNRYVRIFESLNDISDVQLSYAMAIHTSVSNFTNLTAKISETPSGKGIASEAANILTTLELDAYPKFAKITQ